MAALAVAIVDIACGVRFDPYTISPNLAATLEKNVYACQSDSSGGFEDCYRRKLLSIDTSTNRETCYVMILATKHPAQRWLTSEDSPTFDACVTKRAAAAEAAAEPTSTATANDAPTAGKTAFAALETGAANTTCPRVAAADRLLEKLDEGTLMQVVADSLTRTAGWKAADVQRFLLLSARYAETCNQDATNAAVLYDHVAAVGLDEALVERAAAAKECGFLKILATRDLWPFARTFAGEVEAGRYEEAEVTRVLWIETLDRYRTGCAERLSSRERIAAETKIRRLHRIIGLDDPTLIGMRSKMIDALKAGATDKVLALSKAISEREQVLDGANASEYRAKLAAIEGSLADQKKAAGTPAPAKPDATAAAASKSKNVAETAANVAATAKSVAATVETTQQILSIFGI
ncbi:hypothetical protein [Nannocystis sp.]|uniref:hypothetical protein n=1 Tax=Nannocystis sp. TaxID=1962667 RepID=UPI0025EA1B6A|nr:hypothetical protein [Nannocystis sp.]MBK7830036.1 hypothetical protein [Nannocystis sp.]